MLRNILQLQRPHLHHRQNLTSCISTKKFFTHKISSPPQTHLLNCLSVTEGEYKSQNKNETKPWIWDQYYLKKFPEMLICSVRTTVTLLPWRRVLATTDAKRPRRWPLPSNRMAWKRQTSRLLEYGDWLLILLWLPRYSDVGNTIPTIHVVELAKLEGGGGIFWYFGTFFILSNQTEFGWWLH